MRYIEWNSTDPYLNLAAEEFILKNKIHGQYLMLWRNRPSIIIGRYQNILQEVYIERAREYGVEVLRRDSGGGAVYQDEGNLNFSFFSDCNKDEEQSIEHYTRKIAAALRSVGIAAEINGRNDIEVYGRKISGSAQIIAHRRILHHGTLLFDADLDMADYILKPDMAKLSSKGINSVRSRIGNIKDYLPPDKKNWSVQSLKDHLIGWFSEQQDEKLSIEENISDNERLQIDYLANEKYRKRKRTGEEEEKNNEFNYSSSVRTEGGRLSVLIRLQNRRIDKIHFRGDYLSRKPVADVENRMIGLPFKKEPIEAVLTRINVEDYFGGITVRDILDCIFQEHCVRHSISITQR